MTYVFAIVFVLAPTPHFEPQVMVTNYSTVEGEYVPSTYRLYASF